VNDYTVDYGKSGRQAVQELLDRGSAAGIIPHQVAVSFVDDGSRA
jgi:predicted solute-binding protein